MEDLASEFGLHTQEAIDRVIRLKEMNRLTGLIDDRGKFIYITEEEMNRVAQHIQKKGRISIHELAAESNRLIKLKPEIVDDTVESKQESSELKEKASEDPNELVHKI